jgi:hypothetical protein
VLGHVDHGSEEREAGRILEGAHILAEHARISEIHDADPGVGIEDKDIVGETLPPYGAGGSEQPRLRFAVAHCAGFGRVLEAVGHLPHRVDHRMRPFGTLGDQFGAGNRENCHGDKSHEDRTGKCHRGELGGDRAVREHAE